jgi:hypothetical protein
MAVLIGYTKEEHITVPGGSNSEYETVLGIVFMAQTVIHKGLKFHGEIAIDSFMKLHGGDACLEKMGVDQWDVDH